MGAGLVRIPAAPRRHFVGRAQKNINQRAVAPQAQSLCFAVQRRQLQCSHQIHLRWFTSSTKRATIQRRIEVRVTLPTVWVTRGGGNGPGGPIAPAGGPSQTAAATSAAPPNAPFHRRTG